MASVASSSDAGAGIGAALLDAEDRNQRRAGWRTIAVICGAAAVISFVFGTVMATDRDLGGTLLSGVQGIVNSLMVSVPVVWLELMGSRSRLMRLARGWPFGAYLLAKIALYLVLIVGSVQLARLLFNPLNPQSLGFDRSFFEILLFASAMSLVTNAVVEVGRLVGFREMGRLLTGRYFRPRQERRVFLMVDMKDSTAAAEQLGDVAFHLLLNAFFRHVADAAYDHDAEIHKYIGDEAILTWPEAAAMRHARCALCPFGIARRIERTADDYRRRFGFVPKFRAALNAGNIVAGEMGAMKREIAFIGDTLNTTARLVDVALPAAQLRGKERPLPVSALRLA